MKKLLFVAVLSFISFQGMSQGYEKGTKNLNLGLGLGYGIGANASFDLGVHDVISAGLVGSFSTKGYGYASYNWRVNYITAGARVAAHFGKYLSEPLKIDASKFDPYIGVAGGFRNVSYSDNYSSYYNGSSTGIYFGGFVGLRYALKKNLGVYAEAGTPFSSLGITFKF